MTVFHKNNWTISRWTCLPNITTLKYYVSFRCLRELETLYLDIFDWFLLIIGITFYGNMKCSTSKGTEGIIIIFISTQNIHIRLRDRQSIHLSLLLNEAASIAFFIIFVFIYHCDSVFTHPVSAWFWFICHKFLGRHNRCSEIWAYTRRVSFRRIYWWKSRSDWRVIRGIKL